MVAIFYAGLNSIMWLNLPHQKALKWTNDFSFLECCLICAEQKPSSPALCVSVLSAKILPLQLLKRRKTVECWGTVLVSSSCLCFAACLISHKAWAALLGWKVLISMLSIGPHLCPRNCLRWYISNRRPGLSYFVPRSYLSELFEATDQD